ncbi:copper chaperone PCu(A)C [Sphingosinicella rhizophila]|uniref:Copper chaperone PCu(A)C n=1 Tax=Sphingosinicella rhizophila TaxID=3050082 RepID=A0ABU3Q8P4_9SPHN|nr:copper chaperone PCu(A)C [Sphingosinicella sp. GR2756]MDT9599778.1 copper chaperone PCu(A)C [Sphingosinicella sp. GR2756]
MINSLRPIAGSASLALALLLSACGREPQAPRVSVEDIWVRLPAAPGRPAAAYFTATATTKDEAIVAVSSPAAKVEMHETVTEGTMSMMRPLSVASFAGEDRIRFEPGGKHLMLFGLDPKLRPGEKIPLSFRFRSAPPVTVQAELKALGESGPEHAGH